MPCESRANGRARAMEALSRGTAPPIRSIGRALISSPLLVSRTTTKIEELKRRFGLTVLMAERNFHQAVRCYVIVHGEIAFEGKTTHELRSNGVVKQLYLGGAWLPLRASARPKVVT